MQETIIVYSAIGGFALLFLYCLVQTVKNCITAHENPAYTSYSPGFNFRVAFHSVLMIATLARMGALITEAQFEDVDFDGDSIRSWTNDVSHAFPSMLYFTTYSLLILFWAKIVHGSGSVEYPAIWPFFAVLNVLIYAGFFIGVGITAVLKEWGSLRVVLIYLLGSISVLAAVGFLFYGCKVVSTLQERDDAGAYQTRRKIIMKMAVLCIMCAITFICRAVYEFMVASGQIEPYYDFDLGHRVWDSIYYSGVELVPSLIVLIMTYSKERTSEWEDHKTERLLDHAADNHVQQAPFEYHPSYASNHLL